MRRLFAATAVLSCVSRHLPSLLQSAQKIEEGYIMSLIVAGFVKNGVVVPNMPLPEGSFVEVHVIRAPIEVPPELQAELDAWQLASAQALELVERLAQEGEANEKR
jgi:hypothetical protein